MMLGLVVTLFGMIVYFSLASPDFLSARNFLNIGRAISIRGIVAVGLTIVMIAGGLDLSVTAIMAAVNMASIVLIRGGSPEWLAALLGCAMGGGMGATNGLIIIKARINPIVGTLATMSIIRGVAFVLSKDTPRALSIGPDQFSFLARGEIAGVPTALIWWVAACAVGHFILRYTLFGHYVYGIGGSAEACRVSGVRVDYWRFLTYVMCGLAAGFAGLMLLSLSSTAYASAAMGAELEIMGAVILGGVGLAGGRGGIVGTMLGTLILGVMSNGMTLTGIPVYWQHVARGAILLIAVTLDSLRTGGGYR
jgi:ribose transport system permease protein